MKTEEPFRPVAYSAIVTRSYKLPQSEPCAASSLFGEQQNRHPTCDFVFDDRYLCRRRIALTELTVEQFEDSSPHDAGATTRGRVTMTALVHRSGFATIINRLEFDKTPTDDFIRRLHQAWCQPAPSDRILRLLQKDAPEGSAGSIRYLCDVGYILLAAKLGTGGNTEAPLGWSQALDCALQPHKHPGYFPWLTEDPDRPPLPTLFGCASVFSVDELPGSPKVLNTPLLANLVSSERRKVLLRQGFDSATDTVRLVLNRNSALLFLQARADRDTEIDRFACALGFLNLVRHFSNSLGTLASRDLDALNMGRRARKMLSCVSLRQRELTYLHDELHNLNIWHSPELVQLSHAAFDRKTEWELDEEIDKTKRKVDQLIRFTDELAKTQSATSRRWMRALLVIIGGLQLLEIIPVLPDLAAWPTTQLAWLIGVVLAAAIIAFFWDNT